MLARCKQGIIAELSIILRLAKIKRTKQRYGFLKCQCLKTLVNMVWVFVRTSILTNIGTLYN